MYNDVSETISELYHVIDGSCVNPINELYHVIDGLCVNELYRVIDGLYVCVISCDKWLVCE